MAKIVLILILLILLLLILGKSNYYLNEIKINSSPFCNLAYIIFLRHLGIQLLIPTKVVGRFAQSLIPS